MAINRGYVPNHKFYDEMGRITPNVDWSESHRPHFEAQVAGWLPVVRYETELNAWFVASSGKVVSVDRAGDLCLAGFRKLWANYAGDNATTVLQYTADDVAAGVIDLTTGVAVTGATTYAETVITTALRERGLIESDERAMDFISNPIGYASYNYYQVAGTDARNPSTYTYHNFKPQELAAITCDYAIVVPQTPAVATAETMSTDNTGGADNKLELMLVGTDARATGWFNATQIGECTRYANETLTNVVCYSFANTPVAGNTASTPITSDATSGLVNEKTSISGLGAAGDWFLDKATGLLFLFETGGDALPSPFTAGVSTITYYHYASIPTSVSTYFCAVGDIKEGDMLTYDTNSNLVKADLDFSNAMGYDASGNTYFGGSDPEYDSETTNSVVSRQLEQGIMNWNDGVIGQVLNTIEYPRDYLDRVRTAFEGGVSSPNAQTGMSATAVMQSPGSATGGRSDQLTYTDAATTVLIVNWINR